MTAPSLPRSPGERPALRSVLPLPLVTALFAAGAAGGAVALAPQSVRLPLAGGAGAVTLLLTVAVAVAVHARVSVGLLRHRLNAVSRDAGLLLREQARMAEEFGQDRRRLTEEFVQERARVAAEFARERARLTTESGRERERLSEERDRTAEDGAQERARLTERAERAETDRTAVLAVTANVAGRMQALATGTLADLRAMEERHADEDVLADLLHLDHRTAQAGRLADSVAVLAGARSGRRWARPIPMESILRGAMGRIGAYRRVRLHSSSEAAVAGHAAEGVMHALAELLDNAATFSPPSAEVHVYVEEVPAGAIISVEDSGLVMSDIQLRRAERAVSGESAGLTGLSGTRLGLAVVGRLARKYGLKISFRPSARGGTGVLMLIPQDVLAGTIPSATPTAAPDRSRPYATPTGAPDRSRPYGTVRAPHDLDAEPTPTHEFPPDVPAAPVADPVADALIDSLSGYRTGAPASPDAPTDSPAPGSSSGPSTGSPSGSPFSSSSGSSFSSEFGSGFGSGFGSESTSQPGSLPGSFPGSEPGFPTAADEPPTAADSLPRRRRGQSLADAEARSRSVDAFARPERASRPAEDAGTGAVRFSSFRRAVRGTGGLDQAFVQGTAAGDEGATGMPRAAGGTGTAKAPGAAVALGMNMNPSGALAQEAALEPVQDADPPEEVVPQPELEPAREPGWGAVRGSAWAPPEPAREAKWEPEAVRETTWSPEAVRETAWEPEPARGLPWEPEATREPTREQETARQPEAAVEPAREPEAARQPSWEPQATREPTREQETAVEPAREPEAAKGLAWEADAARELAWAPEPVREAKWEPDPVRELAWEPVRDTRPAPDNGTAPTLTPSAPDNSTAPTPSYPATGLGPDPDRAPDPAGARPPAPSPDPRTHPHLEGDHTP